MATAKPETGIDSPRRAGPLPALLSVRTVCTVARLGDGDVSSYWEISNAASRRQILRLSRKLPFIRSVSH